MAGWCDHLRHDQSLSAKTVGSKYLAAVRAIYRVAVSKLKLETDPTAGVTVKDQKVARTRSKGFTDDEAHAKAQAILIEKLRHQLAGHRAHRFGTSSETEQLQLALESSEIAAAAMTARLRLPDVEEKNKAEAPADPGSRPAHGGRAHHRREELLRVRRDAPSAGRGRHRGAGSCGRA